MTSMGDVQYPEYPSVDVGTSYDYYDTQARDGSYYRQPTYEDPYTSGGTYGYADYESPPHYPSHGGPPSYSDYVDPGVHAHPPQPHPYPHPYSHPHPPPPLPPPQPQPTNPTIFGKFKKGGGSAMSALTLLSFLFFVNMLQNCLKEHINTMNPTVMVMTNTGIRNRVSKLNEMNSREQNSASDSASDHLKDVKTSAPPATIAATLSVVQHAKPATESVPIIVSNSATPSNVDQHKPKPHESPFNYNNQTVLSEPSYPYSSRYHPDSYYNDRYHSPYSDDRNHWSHHRPHSHHEHNSPLDFNWDRYDDRQYPNHDSYDDGYYLRIY